MAQDLQGGRQIIIPILIALVLSGIAIGSVVVLSEHREQNRKAEELVKEQEPPAPKNLEIVTKTLETPIPFVFDPIQITGGHEAYDLNATLSNIENRRDVRLGLSDIETLREQFFLISDSRKGDLLTFYANMDDTLPMVLSSDAVLEPIVSFLQVSKERITNEYLISDLSVLLNDILTVSMAQHEYLQGTNWEEAAKRNVAYFALVRQLVNDSHQIPELVKEEVNTELSSLALERNTFDSEVMAVDGAMIAVDIQTYPREGSGIKKALWYLANVEFDLADNNQLKSAILASLAFAQEETTSQAFQGLYTKSQFLDIVASPDMHTILDVLAKLFDGEFDVRNEEQLERVSNELQIEKWSIFKTRSIDTLSDIQCVGCDTSLLQIPLYLGFDEAKHHVNNGTKNRFEPNGNTISEAFYSMLSQLNSTLSGFPSVFSQDIWGRKSLQTVQSLIVVSEKTQERRVPSLQNAQKHDLAYIEPEIAVYEYASQYLAYMSEQLGEDVSSISLQAKEISVFMKRLSDLSRKELNNEELSVQDMQDIKYFIEFWDTYFQNYDLSYGLTQSFLELGDKQVLSGIGPVQEMILIVPINGDLYFGRSGMYGFGEIAAYDIDEVSENAWQKVWENGFDAKDWQKPFISE